MRRTPIRIGLLTLLISGFYARADRLIVTDERGLYVGGATVLVGQEANHPYPLLVADTLGEADLPDSTLPITVSASGFVTTTLTPARGGDVFVRLPAQNAPVALEVRGTTTGYGRLIQDGKVDFGLVIPALGRADMLSFDISSIVSADMDAITIVGNEVKIPSNLALPEQRETFIFPITLKKPDYRMSVRQPGVHTFGTLHGQFPLQRVINDIRAGKSFFDVINYFEFKEGGQRELDIQNNMAGIDLPVNLTPFGEAMTVEAPAFDGKFTMLSLGLIENADVFLPTDVKHFEARQTLGLRTSSTAGHVANLSILLEKDKDVHPTGLAGFLHQIFSPLIGWLVPTEPTAAPDFNRLSFAFTPSVADVVRPAFLPLIEKPVLEGSVMSLTPPTTVPGLAPLAMYLTFAEIEEVASGNITIERRTRIWDVWTDKWLAQVDLPKIDWVRRPDRKYRWDVLFLARPDGFSGESQVGSRVDLKTITHATRNSLDI